MVNPRGSTCALGFDAICLGSVIACGAVRVWAVAMFSVTAILIEMTIAKTAKVRMDQRPRKVDGRESLAEELTGSRSYVFPPCSRSYRRHGRCFPEGNPR